MTVLRRSQIVGLVLALIAALLVAAPAALAQVEREKPDPLADEANLEIDDSEVPDGTLLTDPVTPLTRSQGHVPAWRSNDSDARQNGLAPGLFDSAVPTAERGKALPVTVRSATANGERAAAAQPRLRVEVLDTELAASLSPIGAAAVIEATDEKGRAVDGSFVVEMDLADVRVPFGGDGFGRLQLWWYGGCTRAQGDVLCDWAMPVDTEVVTTERLLRATIDPMALEMAWTERVELLVKSGLSREEVTAPIIQGDGRAAEARSKFARRARGWRR